MLVTSLEPLISFLLGDIGSTSPPADISFTVPSGPGDIAKIPSLNSTVPKPEPRKGCTIGWKNASSLPSKTRPMEAGDFGRHVYGGPSGVVEVSPDEIGHIYTKYGGIIDVAHVRDHADIARYIATNVVAKFKIGGEIPLGDDRGTDRFRIPTGQRIVKIKRQGADPTAYQAAVLGAVISYEVAIWHEIATYKTWQNYSSFSPEDNYSNLLGAYVGFRACLTEGLVYNNAAAVALLETIGKLRPQSKLVTMKAVEFVKDHWYHYSEYDTTGPDIYLFLDRRHMATGYNEKNRPKVSPSFFVSPWLITDVRKTLPEECQSALITNPPSNFRIGIHIPKTDENNKPLRDFYSFEVKNPANADSSIFEHLDITKGVDSTKFGIIVEAIKEKLLWRASGGLLIRDLNIDKPD